MFAVFLLILFLSVPVIWFVPEFPLSILVAGMSFWNVVPGLDRFPALHGNALLVTVVASFLALALHAAVRRRRFVLARIQKEDVLMLAFSFWVALGILWSEYPDYGKTKFLAFAAYTLCGYLVVRFIYPTRSLSLRRLAVLLCAVGLGQAIVALFLARLGPGSFFDLLIPRVTLRSLGLNPIYETKGLVTGILASLWLLNLRTSSPLYRRAWRVLVPLIIVFLLSLVAYGQRGAVLSLVCSSIFLLLGTAYTQHHPHAWPLRRITGSGRSRFVLTGLILLLGLTAVFISLSSIFSVSYVAGDESVLLRVQWYQIGVDVFRSAPITGVGTGGMGGVLDSAGHFYVHNRILEILAENGIVGFSILLALTLSVAAKIKKLLGGIEDPAAYQALLPTSILLHEYMLSMVSTSLGQWSIGVWMALIVSISDSVRPRRFRILPLRLEVEGAATAGSSGE